MSFTIPGIERDLKEFRKEERVRFRLLVLLDLVTGVSFKRVSLKYGISDRTLARWKSRYVNAGAPGLLEKPKSGRPRSRKWLRGKVAGKVLFLRKRYGWGAEVIAAHLEKLYGIRARQSDIHCLLKSKGLLKKQKRKLKNKHTKRAKIHKPGERTQMDVRHLDPVSDENKRYVYNFVDHASKWSFKRVYDSYGPSETRDFMRDLLIRVPFIIERLQTDNGIEFTNRFLGDKKHILEEICERKNIKLRFIPPGEKELNGLVEAHHRIDKDEFFTRLGKKTVSETNSQLKEYLEFRNSQRGFKTNDWQSPDQFLKGWAARMFGIALYLVNKSRPKAEDLSQIPMAA